MAKKSGVTIYDYRNYKTYLRDEIDALPRGAKLQLAKSARIQSAYLSHVLHRKAEINLDQAYAMSGFLGHSEEEKSYFLALVEHHRASTPELKKFLETRLEALRERKSPISEKIQVRQELQVEKQMLYYSAWYYSAIHILCGIKNFQTPSEIALALELSIETVNHVLQFLIDGGLLIKDGNQFRRTEAVLHLAPNSPMIVTHHSQWRLQAMQAIQRNRRENIHFSAIISISESDQKKIEQILVNSIDQVVSLAKVAKDEKLFAIAMDFYQRNRELQA